MPQNGVGNCWGLGIKSKLKFNPEVCCSSLKRLGHTSPLQHQSNMPAGSCDCPLVFLEVIFVY